MIFASTRTLLRMLERERESFAAERARLVDQICSLAGKPWTLPPRDTPVPLPPVDEYDFVTPGQLEDDL